MEVASRGTDYLQAEAMPGKAQWHTYFLHFQAGSSTTHQVDFPVVPATVNTRCVPVAGSGLTTALKSST
jgi:hypothetical protein